MRPVPDLAVHPGDYGLYDRTDLQGRSTLLIVDL
jgi:hypothetical protein